MHRFNMAHRKAIDEVFPVAAQTQTPIVAFTATRWGTLLKARPDWSDEPPSAVDCYRYCLSNRSVHVVLTAPESVQQLDENLAVVNSPPMSDHEREQWERYGDVVYSAGGTKDAFESRWP